MWWLELTKQNLQRTLKNEHLISTDKQRNVWSLQLFQDYSFVLDIDAVAGSAGEAFIYLKCKRFSDQMSLVFCDEDVDFDKFKGRKLKKDNTGTLAMASVGVVYRDNNWWLVSAGIEVLLSRLLAIFAHLQSPSRVKRFLFDGEFYHFLAAIEGVWVYLFLSFEAGEDSKSVFDRLSDHRLLSTWRLKQPLSEVVCSRFEKIFFDL